MFQQGGAGGGAQFAFNLSAVGRNPFQNQRRGRGGNRQDPVGAVDMAAARMDRGNDDLIRGKLLLQEAYAHYVRHRVKGTHLMEVDLCDRPAVHPAFRVGNEGIDRFRVGLDPVRHSKAVDQRLNIRDGGMVVMAVMMVMLMFMFMVMIVVMLVIVIMMMVMVMMMIVIVFMVMLMLVFMRVTGFLLHTVHGNRDMGAGDAALDGRLRGDGNAGQAQGIHFVNERLFVSGKLQQGGGQHIARGAHGAFQVQCFHRKPPY